VVLAEEGVEKPSLSRSRRAWAACPVGVDVRADPVEDLLLARGERQRARGGLA